MQAQGRRQGVFGPGARRLLLAFFCTLAAATWVRSPAWAQAPLPPPPPQWAPAPLLHVRIGGLAGLHATFYQGTPEGPDFPAPVVVGLRPGYIYRIRLSGLPGHPDRMLSPTLEVRGSLRLPPRLRAADYPAPITFTPEDIERVLSGAVLTKVVFLEDPALALAEASRADQPLEIEVPPGGDPLAEARARGRPLVIVRLGERDVSREELARQSIPGTIRLPGQTVLPHAVVPPCIPWAGLPVYDPLLGPRFPEEECLHDGGTRRAGIGPDGRPRGLEPSDTVAAYTDSQGRRGLAVSNRICICVPRFVVISGLTELVGYRTAIGPGRTQTVEGQGQVQNRVPSVQVQHNAQLEGFRGRERPSGTVGTQGLGRLLRLEILNAYNVRTPLAEVVDTEALQRLTRQEKLRLYRQMELARQLNQPFAGPRGIVQVQAVPQVVGQVQGVKVTGSVEEVRDLTVACNEPPRPRWATW